MHTVEDYHLILLAHLRANGFLSQENVYQLSTAY